MTLNEARNRIQSRVWREIAQAKLDLSALPRPDLEALVDMVTNAALLEIDDEIGKSVVPDTTHQPQSVVVQTDKSIQSGEEVLWEGRPLLSISVRYMITNERVRITEGIIGKIREDIELVKIRDMSQSQTVSERILNVGDITIRSNDISHPVVILNNIRDPQGVHETLRRAVLKAREKHGLTYREEM